LNLHDIHFQLLENQNRTKLCKRQKSGRTGNFPNGMATLTGRAR